MLFVLRKIRRTLMKENKVTSYLLYAIGEIALIVVGILIALQVDEYRQQIQEKKLQNIYTESLIFDLKNDTATHAKNLKGIIQLIGHLDSVNMLISNPQTTSYDVIEFAKTKYDIALQGYLGIESQTLKSLINTGKYEIYPLEIRNKISELNKINHATSLAMAETISWSLKAVQDHENRFLRGKVNNLMKPNDGLIEEAWSGINKREFISSFINLVDNKYIYTISLKQALEQQRALTTELIHLLENYR